MDRRRSAVPATRVSAETTGTQRRDRWTQERERERFLTDVKRFNENRGTPIARWPVIGGKQLDMYELYNNVTERGGWDKVTTEDLWPEVLDNLNIPSDCANSDQGLRLIYIRYLHLFERANHFKLDPDVRDDTTDNMDEGMSSARKRGTAGSSGANTVCNVALNYNAQQHNLNDMTRDSLGLTKAWDRTSSAAGEYSHLDRALASGLPNEVDFAFNVSLLLSTASKHTLKGAKAVRTVELMLSYVGILKEGEVCLSDVWQSGSTLNFLRFWNESTTDRSVKELVCPECLLTEKGSAVHSTEELAREEAEAADDYWLQNLNRAVGTEDKEGQRVGQLVTIARNLSFEEDNIELMASSLIIFRFLMLCVHNRYGSIRQNALETLSNISSKIVLEPIDCRMTQLVINTVARCLVSTDRLELISGMESLGRLCLMDINEDAICGQLDDAAYTHLIRLLTVYDITILLPALEALYQLSDLGHVCCTRIATVVGAIDVLVDLLTIDAQLDISESALAVKIAEEEETSDQQPVTLSTTLSLGSLSTISGQAGTVIGHSPHRQSTSYFTTSNGQQFPTAVSGSGVVSSSVNGVPGVGAALGIRAEGVLPSPSPFQVVRTVMQFIPPTPGPGAKSLPPSGTTAVSVAVSSRDVELSVRRWLVEGFEVCRDAKKSLSEKGLTKLELYRHYVAALGAHGASSLLGATAFESCVRAAFPGLVVKEDNVLMFGGDAVYCGLVQRSNTDTAGNGQGGVLAITGASSYPVRPVTSLQSPRMPQSVRFVMPQGFNSQPSANQLQTTAVRSVSSTSSSVPDVSTSENCPAIRQVLQGINGAILQQYSTANAIHASAEPISSVQTVSDCTSVATVGNSTSSYDHIGSNQSVGNDMDKHTMLDFKANTDIVASADCNNQPPVSESLTSNIAVSSDNLAVSGDANSLQNAGNHRISSESLGMTLSTQTALSANGTAAIPATDILNCALRLAGIETNGDFTVASENDGALLTGSQSVTQSVSTSTVNGVCSPIQISEVDEKDGLVDRSDPKSLDSLPPDELTEEEEAQLKSKTGTGVANGLIKHVVNGNRNAVEKASVTQDEDSGIACDVSIRKNHSAENGLTGNMQEDVLDKTSNHMVDGKADDLETSEKSKTMMKEVTALVDGLLREELGLQQTLSNGPVSSSSSAPQYSADSTVQLNTANRSSFGNSVPSLTARFVQPPLICQPAPIQIPAHIQARLSALPVTHSSVLAGLPASFRAAIGQSNTTLPAVSNLSNVTTPGQQQLQQQMLRSQLLIPGSGAHVVSLACSNRAPQPIIAMPSAQQAQPAVPLHAHRPHVVPYQPSAPGQAASTSVSILSSTSTVAQLQGQQLHGQQLQGQQLHGQQLQGQQIHRQQLQGQQLHGQQLQGHQLQGQQLHGQQLQGQQLQGQQLQGQQLHGHQLQGQQLHGQQLQGQQLHGQQLQGQQLQGQRLQNQQLPGHRQLFQEPQQQIFIQRGGQVVQYTAAMSPLVGNLGGGRLISGSVGGMTTPGGIAIVPGGVRPHGVSQITFQPSGTARIPIGQPGAANHSFIMVHRRPAPGSPVAAHQQQPMTSPVTSATTSAIDSKSSTPASGKKRKAATPATTKTSKRKKKGGEVEVEVPASEIEVTKYYCEWAGCERVFDTVKQTARHVTKDHFETECATEKSGVCQWSGCDGLVRQRWSLITHLQDRHLSEQSLRSESVARIQRVQNPPSAAATTASKKNAASSSTVVTSNTPVVSTVAAVSSASATTPVMYPQNAALHAIRRFSTRPSLTDFLVEENSAGEVPVTKHVRLTSGLILRNLARYSSLGRSLIRKYENHLVNLAFSNLESSSAISSCLWELQQQ